MSEQKSSYTYDELGLMSEGRYWPEGAPKLPAEPMRMLDRVTQVAAEGGSYGKGQATAVQAVRPDLWFFQCHFKDDPVMPGCLGLDGLWQLMGFYLAWSGELGKARALGVKELDFRGQVLPEAKEVTYQIDIRRLLKMKLTMLIADGRLLVDGEEIYTAKDMRVSLFE